MNYELGWKRLITSLETEGLNKVKKGTEISKLPIPEVAEGYIFGG